MIYVLPMLWGLCVVALTASLLPVSQFHWTGLVITALVVAVVYFAGLVLLRYFDAFDLRVLGRFLPVPESLRQSRFFA